MIGRRIGAVAAVFALALTVAACGGDDDDSSSAATTASSCLEVPATTQQAIASGAGASTGGITPVKAAGYKSPDFEDVTFIAMRFSAEGVDDQVGVWATNNFDTGGGLMLAVDGFAQQFTDFPDADSTEAAIAIDDPGVAKAKDCLD